MYYLKFKALLILILLYSCGQKSDYPTETELFQTYLEKNTTIKDLPIPTSYFLVITSSYCGGCKSLIENEFKEKLKSDNYFLISSAQLDDPMISSSPNYLYDSKRTIDNLNLRIANVGVIVVKDRQIVHIAEVNPNNENILNELEAKYKI